jgi:hypothetical protein
MTDDEKRSFAAALAAIDTARAAGLPAERINAILASAGSDSDAVTAALLTAARRLA